MRLSSLAVCAVVCANTSCLLEEVDVPASGNPRVAVIMTRTEGGSLEYCLGGSCLDLPNPDSCERLVITVDPQLGEPCATCYGAQGAILRASCSQTGVDCVVVSLPEPDCVVCAYVGGAVVYSSCAPTAPPTCAVEEMAPACSGPASCPAPTDCTRCYDAESRLVSDTCAPDCSAVACAPLDCAAGFADIIYPGECCSTCAPIGACESAVCSGMEALLACPQGSLAQRDPADCCRYVCVPVDCSGMVCPDVTVSCPAGFHLENSFPHCCGACVADPPSGVVCVDASDCPDDQICTTSLGECLSACDPDLAAGPDCTLVCTGYCREPDYVCPDVIYPAVDWCEGSLMSLGADEHGCPLPPVCVCDDGNTSFDGTCPDQCAQVACFTMPVCALGETLQVGYPYCCGVCVPADECWVAPASCVSDSECSKDTVCQDGYCLALAPVPGRGLPAPQPTSTTSLTTCPLVMCAAGETTVIGPDCCPACAPPATPCFNSSECAVGEYCTTEVGACEPAPGCVDGFACTPVCYGSCKPK